MSEAFVTFTVQSARCCPVIIAVSHMLFYHRHSLSAEDIKHHTDNLNMMMRDLNKAHYDAIEAMRLPQNATSVPSELSPSG